MTEKVKKIIFRLCVHAVYETNKFHAYTWVPSLNYFTVHMQIFQPQPWQKIMRSSNL